MIQGQKIVTAEEMQRIEKRAIAAGLSPGKFMDKAAEGIASITKDFI